MASRPGKRLTVIIIPRTDQRTLNFSLPTFVAPLLAVILAICAVGGIALSLSYRSMREHITQRWTEFKVVRRINAEQKIQIEVMAIKSREMAADLDKIRTLDQQVRQLIGGGEQPAAPAPVAAIASTTLPTIRPSPSAAVDPQVEAMLDRRDLPVADRAGFDRSRATLTEALTTSGRLDQIKSELAKRLPDLLKAKVKIEDRLDYLAHRPTGWPASGPVTSWFGWRPSPFGWGGDYHPGIDIAVPIGTPVGATADGVVIQVGWSGDYGRLVVVDHGYGFRTYYGHLSTYAVDVGDKVERGTLLGYSGNTGLSTGPHVHYELRLGGTATDPEPYLDPPSTREG